MDEELKRHLADLEARLKSHVDERCEKVETNLLAAFHGWSRSMEVRVRGMSGITMGFDERLALAEERISDLERKKAS